MILGPAFTFASTDYQIASEHCNPKQVGGGGGGVTGFGGFLAVYNCSNVAGSRKSMSDFLSPLF